MSDSFKVYLIHFFRQFMLINSLMLPFLESVGFGSQEFFFLVAFYLIISTIVELPTGIFSDKYGAKLAIICSGVCFFISTIILLVNTQFYSFLIHYFFAACTTALLSGSDDAILVSENALNFMGRKMFIKRVSNVLAGLLAGVVMLSYSFQTLLYIQLGFSLLTIGFAFFIRFKNGSHYRKEKLKISEIFKKMYNQDFARLMITLIFGSLSFFLIANSFQPLLQEYKVPVVYFPFLSSIFMILQGKFCLFAHRLKRFYNRKIVALFSLVSIFFLFIDSYIALGIAFFLILFARGGFFIYFEKFIKETDEASIATTHSFFNFSANLFLSAQTFVLGQLTEYYPLKQSILFIGLFLLISFMIIHYLVQD